MANSAGIMAWPESVTDWIRPGIMLYGVSPFPEKTGYDMGLKPVMSLYSRLIAVNSVAQGDAVGYGCSWLSDRESIIGVVAIGYGDGYPRHINAGAAVLINGQKAPLVGRVSMDMITVDLTEVSCAKIGDQVTLWGEGLPIEEVAKCADTIPYTLLCGVTQRVVKQEI
jgi:alanine racemase